LTRASWRSAIASRSSFGRPFISSPNVTLPSAVRQGNSWAKSWNTTPRSWPYPVIGAPPRRISPAVGGMKPAMMLSSVDLPQPLGPTMQMNSEAAMSKLTVSTACTRPDGVS
jgi:hypothetical protein